MTSEGSDPTMETIDLHLNADDPENLEEESSGGTDHPRRLLRVRDELWAWGGNTRAVRIDGTKVCHWDEDDDDVRAVAVSDDGTVVAVGFDSGFTSLYTYDASEVVGDDGAADAAGGEEKKKKHPFGTTTPSPKHCKAGPTFAAPVRDMQFYPGSSSLLAVATEEGLCVLDLSNDSGTQEKYLEEEAAKHHNGSGIRGIAFTKNIMASLSMDGRLCLWDVSDASPSNWKLLQREEGRCVTKRDLGEMLGCADAWDRSCRPVFLSDPTILALPGETYLQLRKIVDGKNVTVFDQPLEKGHIESVVALASHGSHLVSTGRDKRVVLWLLEEVRRLRPICCCCCWISRYSYSRMFPPIVGPKRRCSQSKICAPDCRVGIGAYRCPVGRERRSSSRCMREWNVGDHDGHSCARAVVVVGRRGWNQQCHGIGRGASDGKGAGSSKSGESQFADDDEDRFPETYRITESILGGQKDKHDRL